MKAQRKKRSLNQPKDAQAQVEELKKALERRSTQMQALWAANKKLVSTLELNPHKEPTFEKTLRQITVVENENEPKAKAPSIFTLWLRIRKKNSPLRQWDEWQRRLVKAHALLKNIDQDYDEWAHENLSRASALSYAHQGINQIADAIKLFETARKTF